MHVAIVSKLYPTLTVSELMTKVIIAEAANEKTVIPVLQRAGFTGAEIAGHLSSAVARADREIGRILAPDPSIIARANAIAGLVARML